MIIQNSYERNGIMSSILDNVQPAVKKETKRVEDHGSWSDSDVDSFCSTSFYNAG